MSDKKSNLKSIRVSDKVLYYIMNYRVNGFNEKFENIILDAMESEDERIATLDMYDKRNKEEKQKYYKMREKLLSLEPMVQACLHVNSRVKELNKSFDVCISKIDPGAPDLQNK